MKPEIAPSLKQIINAGETKQVEQEQNKSDDEIAVGTSCKNGGCRETYNGPESNEIECIYHPGVPVFHEGLKFWSCCQKRTTDFNIFLGQVGCERGSHVWKKDVSYRKLLKWCITKSKVMCCQIEKFAFKKYFHIFLHLVCTSAFLGER